jgi:hypothetical protein
LTNSTWTQVACKALSLTGFSILASHFVGAPFHPIKLSLIALYALYGLTPKQANTYSRNMFNNPNITLPLMLIPYPILSHLVIDPARYAASGTNLAFKIALNPQGPRWCANLSGGYNGAFRDRGSNNSFFNDIAFALINQIEKNPQFKALVIDTTPDIGYGNAELKKLYPDNVTIIDLYDPRASSCPSNMSNFQVENLEGTITHLIPIDSNEVNYSDKKKTLLKNTLDTIDPQKLHCIVLNDPGNSEISHVVANFAGNNHVPFVYIVSSKHRDQASCIAYSLRDICVTMKVIRAKSG